MRLLRRVVDEHGIGAVMTMHGLNKAMHYANSVLMLKDGKVLSYLNTSWASQPLGSFIIQHPLHHQVIKRSNGGGFFQFIWNSPRVTKVTILGI